MTRVSSQLTWWYKIAFVRVFLLMLAISLAVTTTAAIRGRESFWSPLAVLGALLGMVAFSHWIFRPLADEVVWEDERLIVRREGAEETIPWSAVAGARSSALINPEFIILRLRQPGHWGATITFLPTHRWVKLGNHPILDVIHARIAPRGKSSAEEQDVGR